MKLCPLLLAFKIGFRKWRLKDDKRYLAHADGSGKKGRVENGSAWPWCWVCLETQGAWNLSYFGLREELSQRAGPQNDSQVTHLKVPSSTKLQASLLPLPPSSNGGVWHGPRAAPALAFLSVSQFKGNGDNNSFCKAPSTLQSRNMFMLLFSC